MPITTSNTVDYILNRVAVEVGLEAVADPYGSSDANFVALRYLMDVAGEELAIMYDWNVLVTREGIDTALDGTGMYDLPEDFLRLTNQTVYSHTNDKRLATMSPQDWARLNGGVGEDVGSLHSYRLQDGLIYLYPKPTNTSERVSFEYISSHWVLPSGINSKSHQRLITSKGKPVDTSLDKDFYVINPRPSGASGVNSSSDVVVYDRTLFTRYLKLKWLQAKGFESDNAQADFDQIYERLTSTDISAKVLNIGGSASGGQLINPINNLRGTNYGI